MFQHNKPKSASKHVIVKGPKLEAVVLKTMHIASQIVGATLGPGGMPVLIERQEERLPPTITKDGVTVFRALGFEDATMQTIMESARDAAVRTANDVGDGTTSATVLAEAIVRMLSAFTKANPRISPQKVMRRMMEVFKNDLEPAILKQALKADWTTEAGQRLLHAVAKISANGDIALADAVIQCFREVGDDGNVTIAEVSGPSTYHVEAIQGFPMSIGYEDCGGKYYPKFINDVAGQRVLLEKPAFILYHGQITDFGQVLPLLEHLGENWVTNSATAPHNFVLVATGFSDQVTASLAANFPLDGSINIYPLLTPQTPQLNGTLGFLEDLAAITGAKILDPINSPLGSATSEDIGFSSGVEQFEASRWRSNLIGFANEDELLFRAEQLKAQMSGAGSELDKIYLQERLGKLTGGIARLTVSGASNGELKEKKDRAEDAVCAVRGAIKHGCLPGGSWMLLQLTELLAAQYPGDAVVSDILIPALGVPFNRLLENCGLSPDEINEVGEGLFNDTTKVYDALKGEFVDAVEGGVLDSLPAVLESLRNALSIATLLGTLGGTVVFGRDHSLDLAEAQSALQFERDANTGE